MTRRADISILSVRVPYEDGFLPSSSHCAIKPEGDFDQTVQSISNSILANTSHGAFNLDVSEEQRDFLLKLNLDFLQIDKKIIEMQSMKEFSGLISHDYRYETSSDDYLYPEEGTSIERRYAHRRSCSNVEFTHQESRLRDYLRERDELQKLTITEKKRELQQLIKEFLVNASKFREGCKEAEKIEHVNALIYEIKLLERELANQLSLNYKDTFDMETLSESESSESEASNLSGQNSASAMIYSSESESSESETASLSDDGDSLDSPIFEETSFNVISKEYLQKKVMNAEKSREIDKLCETLFFLRGIKELDDKKIELDKRALLNLGTSEYIQKSIKHLENKLKAVFSTQSLNDMVSKALLSKEIEEISRILEILRDLKELECRKTKLDKGMLFRKEELDFINDQIKNLERIVLPAFV